jgi:SAM-dependent methyltransferase
MGSARPDSAQSGYEKAAHLYDLFDNKPNIPFFLHYGCEAGEILDVGAGTDRIAIPLAEHGVHVVCIEPSPAMRGEFERKLQGRDELADRITLIAGDARSFSLGWTYSAAFLSGTFDHFLSDEERLASLANIARHLRPKGKLVLDVFLALMGNRPLAPAGRVERGAWEYRCFVGSRLINRDCLEVRLVFETYQAGALMERVEEHSLVGIVNRDQVCRLLQQARFDVKREFSGYDFAPFREGDALWIAEAAKR